MFVAQDRNTWIRALIIVAQDRNKIGKGEHEIQPKQLEEMYWSVALYKENVQGIAIRTTMMCICSSEDTKRNRRRVI